jgi:hypothetical protein
VRWLSATKVLVEQQLPVVSVAPSKHILDHGIADWFLAVNKLLICIFLRNIKIRDENLAIIFGVCPLCESGDKQTSRSTDLFFDLFGPLARPATIIAFRPLSSWLHIPSVIQPVSEWVFMLLSSVSQCPSKPSFCRSAEQYSNSSCVRDDSPYLFHGMSPAPLQKLY